ncbi:MAG TPA: efflux RND transporter periplasmic adaptor subunit [Prosthecochloris aestuarii]|uniref:Efflux RND transporter periplasmic adaptor subunit n=1 Tax=Prosthecochloris aestuarii TaxID=1102 RepID=A0A831SSB5_PROAE|nr:efflux RND transporter periplasmic adaptor subunit [Prosthecochloris sp.]HED31560.1 efflux RND transporter periplasmic adaptor subunit [Prosthecochloris aestuarii]
MQTLQKILPRYSIALGILFLATVVFMVTRGDVVHVETLEIRPMELVQAVYATGYVDADERAELRSEVASTVVSVPVREGEQVKKGDVLVVFDDEPVRIAVDEARSALLEQESLSAERTQKFRRQQSLFRAGAVSREELDTARYSYQQSLQRLHQRKLQLQARLEELENLEIRAPFDGIVSYLGAKRGDDIAATVLVATVVNPSSYVISAEIDELDVPKIEPGQEAVVALDAMPRDKFDAVVDRLVPATDKVTKTSQVFLRIRGGAAGMQTGMTATANIVFSRRDGALLVPKLSVIDDASGRSVWKIENGRLVLQTVLTGASDLTHFEITGGLNEGDRIVLRPEDRFREGMQVRSGESGEQKSQSMGSS